MDFKEWLKCEKKYTDRSASDILSRIKRVRKILNIKTVEENSEKILEEHDKFKDLSCSVKSQLRKALRLYRDFKGELKEND